MSISKNNKQILERKCVYIILTYLSSCQKLQTKHSTLTKSSHVELSLLDAL